MALQGSMNQAHCQHNGSESHQGPRLSNTDSHLDLS